MIRIRTIGQGGLGVVALYQSSNERFYAVKQMLYSWDADHFARFKREIKIMAGLVHKNIIKVLKYDTNNNNPWYVMPYYKDGSLRDKILDLKAQGKAYSIKGASGIIYYLADALKYAHKNGVIHRDLKPENILFNGQEPIIADWGIGKFIHRESKVLTNGAIGTKTYCSPEQWENGTADERSDIFSLGIIYRELLTGKVHGPVKDPQVNLIINKMTMMSPSDRHQTMDELMEDIKSLEIISTKNPLADFWTAALVTAGVVGLVYLLSKAFED